ncbi:tRNA dihydrouridine synthase DusB [Roseiterribacter gracilis]|uniref:tRNA-dihydrouridine synthase n=1 Tax=Roseiterribacter gracilis TaxID=2812848 RepID=A0A8S8X9K7_9PROT|nr:tRNA-dihydrouridine synthase [Rhodospirillales bacterium TMPK1]
MDLPPLQIGPVEIPGGVLLAPMTGISDLPFRRVATRLGAPYVATEMVACAELARGRRDVMQRAALDETLPTKIVQLVGCEARWIREGTRLADYSGADIIDLNFGCPAKEVTGKLAGSALMRDLDQAEKLLQAAVESTDLPVTLKMRLGWDDASKNAPDLAQRAEKIGIRAITVHGRTRQQFYDDAADWDAVRDVVNATSLPVIVNGDIVDADSARTALERSGARAVMIGRGGCGRPWLARELGHALATGEAMREPDAATRYAIVLEHLHESLAFYGDVHGVRVFKKHLGWYVLQAPWPEDLDERRAAKARLCRLNDPHDIERDLASLWGV